MNARGAARCATGRAIDAPARPEPVLEFPIESQPPHYFRADWVQPSQEDRRADICVYGASAAGVVAAVKAARLGHDVVLLQPGRAIGGMTTGGLGETDFGNKHTIGGMAAVFYRTLGEADGEEAAWKFWPQDASRVLEGWLAESGADVRLTQYLDGVEMDAGRIAAVRMLGGLRVEAKVFIDATYEGDLLAAAGVSHHIGRESNAVYNETLNGVQPGDKHQFLPTRVDPFVTPGDPSSGLLPAIESRDLRKHVGRGDHKVQAYCFRMCMTDDPALRIDWEKPDGYDPMQYELAARWCAAGAESGTDRHPLIDPDTGVASTRPHKFDLLAKPTPAGHRKTDTNNHGAVSSDFIGANYAWPTADYAIREAIFQQHVRYQKGLYWFFANDERLDDTWHRAYRRWGLARDEFTDTGGWPHQLYVRESRRMIAEHVITEHDCLGTVRAEDPVGQGSYTMDSHNCSRFVAEVDGQAVAMNEGDIQVPPTDPYPISYRAIVPRRDECANLLVPVCFSASHIAYGSARMEPVFMVLGESAACAASLALKNGGAVQDVPYAPLRSMLDDAGAQLGDGL
ncbi:MAG: FAD-dependent oxidoreductase [Planctomycetota bacterium]